jgi:Staphylococcal protein of unknown function (DUF960)
VSFLIRLVLIPLSSAALQISKVSLQRQATMDILVTEQLSKGYKYTLHLAGRNFVISPRVKCILGCFLVGVFIITCEIKDGKRYQKIVHSQLVPKFKNAALYETENAVTEKIYVIEDKTHITMLFASEY